MNAPSRVDPTHPARRAGAQCAAACLAAAGCLAAASGSARAGDQERCFVQGGLHATWEAGLAPGVRIEEKELVDVDRDGTEDALLHARTGEPCEGSSGALLLGRHQGQGFRVSVVALEDEHNTYRWQKPLASGGVPLLALSHVQREDDPRRPRSTTLDLRALDAAEEFPEVLVTEPGEAPPEVRAGASGTLLVTFPKGSSFQLWSYSPAWRRFLPSERTTTRPPFKPDSGQGAVTLLGAGHVPDCSARPRSAVALRTSLKKGDKSTKQIAAGTPLRVTRPTLVKRGAATLYEIASERDGTGYVFLQPRELDPACPR